jgi:hypothetical protein
VIERHLGLIGLILWARNRTPKRRYITPEERVAELVRQVTPGAVAVELAGFLDQVLTLPQREPSVWRVSLNRQAQVVIHRSVAAVKGDAARNLFNISCKDITWAVLDCELWAKVGDGVKG